MVFESSPSPVCRKVQCPLTGCRSGARGVSLSNESLVHYYWQIRWQKTNQNFLSFGSYANRSTSFLQPFQKLKWTYFTEPEEPLFFYGAPTQPAHWGDIFRSPEPRSLGLFSRELWVSLMSRVMRGSTPGGGVTWDTSGDWPDSPEPGTITVYNGDFLILSEKKRSLHIFFWLLGLLSDS